MLVAIKFLTIFAAGAVAPAFLIPLFLEDNHSKNKATAKRLSKLGEENAETEISKIISQKGQGDSLENKGDPIPNEKEENKSVAIHNVGVGITPRSATQLSTSENEMTKTI
jgi:hypothetical protein